MRPLIPSTVGAAMIGLLAAACSSGSATPAPSHAAASSPGAGTAAVSLRTIAKIPGQALAGRDGRTLYLFEGDKNGKPMCSGACATAWPPDLANGRPRAGSGVSQSMLGTVRRPGGAMQVTYNGHPLYYFSGDSRPGLANGQGVKAFGGDWYVVSASGNKIDTG